VRTVTAPDSTVSDQRYPIESGLRIRSLIDAKRHQTDWLADAFGRQVQVKEFTGDCASYWGYTCAGSFTTAWNIASTTNYAYSSLDLLTTATDTLGNSTQASYDSLGRKRTTNDPDMGVWAYSYDPNGNLLTQRDAKNQALTFSDDRLDRLTGKRDRGPAIGFSDGFDPKRTDIWGWNGNQTVPYNDSDNNVVRSEMKRPMVGS